ncbi:MAG: VCBS repeat-containing protein [Bryobacteraceae bacterium]
MLFTAFFLASAVLASAANPTTSTFFARRAYPGLLTYWLQVADTNGDGIPDLVVSGANIEVELGNGNGTFRVGPTSNLAGGETGQFILQDLNGDGIVDIAYTAENRSGEGIGISLGNGNGTFQSGAFYNVPDTGLRYLVVGDFNGDGILDVAASGTSGLWLLTGQGGGLLNPATLVASLPTEVGPIAAADFNQDGNLDLVVGQDGGGTDASGAGFAVLLGNGNGTFHQPQIFAAPKAVSSITAGSLTKGGYPSVVVSTKASNDVFIYTGNAAGTFSGPSYADLPGYEGVAIGDVNGDGIPDLVSTQGYIALGKGNGKFDAPYQYTINEVQQPRNVVLADLRNDGLTDILTSGYYAVSVLLSEGKGAYEDGIWTSVSGGTSCGVAADFNGDGRPDLAVITSTGVSILLGTGKAASPFTPGSTIAINGAACLVTGDLNGDGIPDLLVAVNGSPNALVSYLGNGNGTFTLTSTTPTPNSGGAVVLGISTKTASWISPPRAICWRWATATALSRARVIS